MKPVLEKVVFPKQQVLRKGGRTPSRLGELPDQGCFLVTGSAGSPKRRHRPRVNLSAAFFFLRPCNGSNRPGCSPWTLTFGCRMPRSSLLGRGEASGSTCPQPFLPQHSFSTWTICMSSGIFAESAKIVQVVSMSWRWFPLAPSYTCLLL